MSTAGRINKSTTKFVPKRKSNPSQRASSATPSLSGTPRVVAQSLPALDGISETTPYGTEQSPAGREVFLAPRPPTSKGKGPAHVASSPRVPRSPLLAPASSPGNALGFGPSDPSARRPPTSPVAGPAGLGLSSSPQTTQTQTHSMPMSSLGLGFGPSGPTASSQATSFGPSQFGPGTQVPSSPSLAPPARLDYGHAPSSSPGRPPSKGHAFSVGLRGPPGDRSPGVAARTLPPPSSPSGTPIRPSNRSPDSRALHLELEQPTPVASTSKSVAFAPSDPSAGPTPAPASDSAPVATAEPTKPASKGKRPLRKPKQATAPAPAPASEPTPAELMSQLTAAVNQAAEVEGMAPVATDGEGAEASDGEPLTQREMEAAAAAAKKAKARRGRGKKGAKKGVEEEEEEEEDEVEAPKTKKARVAKPRAKAAAKGKGKGKQKAVASDDQATEDEGEGQDEAARPKKRAPRKETTKKSAVVEDLDAPMHDSDEAEAEAEADDGSSAEVETDADEAGSEVDEYDKLKPKKRRVRKKSTKPLFRADSDEETEEQTAARKAEEQAALALLPAEDVLSEYNTDGSESGSDGERKPVRVRTLRKKTYLEKIRIHVDPVQTTMFELSTAKDVVWGRESTRGRQLTKLVIDKKEQRRIARAKMKQRTLKEHAKRQARARGEDVPDSDDEGDENGDGDGENGDGSMTGSRAGSPAVLNRPNGNGEDVEMDADGAEAKANGEEDEEDDDVGELTETFYVPQMRMVDGQMVIDDASLEVDRSADPNMQDTQPREVIEETGRERMVNSATWSRHTIKTDKWTPEETEDFYDALHQWGTDFEMIAMLFPLRNRRQIKAKWTREDKLHPQRITHALMNRKKIDLDQYAEKTGQNLSGPVPDDPLEAINKLRDEQEAAAKEAGGPVYGMPAGERRGGKRKKKEEEEEVVEPQGAEEEEEEDSGEESEDEVAKARREEEEQRLIDEEIARAEQEEKGKNGKRKTRRG